MDLPGTAAGSDTLHGVEHLAGSSERKDTTSIRAITRMTRRVITANCW